MPYLCVDVGRLTRGEWGGELFQEIILSCLTIYYYNNSYYIHDYCNYYVNTYT